VRRAAEFWSAALGYKLREDGFGGWAKVLVPPDGAGTAIALQLSQTPPPDHPRLHFDLHVAGAAEQEAEVAAVTGSGSGSRGGVFLVPGRRRRRARRLGHRRGGEAGIASAEPFLREHSAPAAVRHEQSGAPAGAHGGAATTWQRSGAGGGTTGMTHGCHRCAAACNCDAPGLCRDSLRPSRVRGAVRGGPELCALPGRT
jgi:Glyoxalase-like domain